MRDCVEDFRKVQDGYVDLDSPIPPPHQIMNSNQKLAFTRMKFPEPMLKYGQDTVIIQVSPDVTAYYMLQ